MTHAAALASYPTDGIVAPVPPNAAFNATGLSDAGVAMNGNDQRTRIATLGRPPRGELR